MKKRNIYIATIIIALATIIIILSLKFFNSKKREREDIINYFIIYGKQGVGVVDKEGKKIIESKYLDIVIPDHEHDVFLCYEKNFEFKILNKEGKEVLQDIDGIEPIQSTAFEKMAFRKLMKYKDGDKFGLIDVKGKKITKAIYDQISIFPNDMISYKIVKNGKIGLLDLNGKTKIKPEYTEIIITMPHTSTPKEKEETKVGYILKNITDSGQKFGFADENGKILIPVEYENITRKNIAVRDYLLITQQAGRKGLFKNNNKILDEKYKEVSPSAYYAVIKQYNKYAMYSLDGRKILNDEFDSYKIYGKYILFTKDDKNYMYDFNGNKIDSNNLIIISDIPDKHYIIVKDKEQRIRIISNNNLLKAKFDEVEYAFKDYFITKTDQKYGIFDARTEEMVISETMDYIKKYEDTNILMVYKGEHYDIYDSDIVKINFDDDFGIKTLTSDIIQIFSKNNMAYLNSDGVKIDYKKQIKAKYYASQDPNTKLWGYSDVNNKVVVEQKYQLVTDFNEYGFATIKKNNLYGVIDDQLNIVVEPKHYFTDRASLPSFMNKYLINENAIATLIELDEENSNENK